MLSSGTVNMTAVKNLLKKKKIGTIILILRPLSMFRTSELKFYFTSFIFMNGNLLQMSTLKLNGRRMETTTITYDAIFANFLAGVFDEPSVSFMTEKKVKS